MGSTPDIYHYPNQSNKTIELSILI